MGAQVRLKLRAQAVCGHLFFFFGCAEMGSGASAVPTCSATPSKTLLVKIPQKTPQKTPEGEHTSPSLRLIHFKELKKEPVSIATGFRGDDYAEVTIFRPQGFL